MPEDAFRAGRRQRNRLPPQVKREIDFWKEQASPKCEPLAAIATLAAAVRRSLTPSRRFGLLVFVSRPLSRYAIGQSRMQANPTFGKESVFGFGNTANLLRLWRTQKPEISDHSEHPMLES
jgi:hypothetical protein